MKCVSDLITVLLFTSPTHSNPSTIHIQRAIKTLNVLWGLKKCRKIILCDGFAADKSKMFSSWSMAVQSGLDVNDVDPAQYEQYIKNLHVLCDIDPAFENVEIVEMESHGGLTGSTMHGLRMATTPLTLHFEHDYYACVEIDLCNVANVMMDHPDIQYIRFNLCANLLSNLFAEKRGNGYVLDTVLIPDDSKPIPLLKTDGWASLPHLMNEKHREYVLTIKNNFHHHEIERIMVHMAYRNGLRQLLHSPQRLSHSPILKDGGLHGIYKKGFEAIHEQFGTYVYGNLGDERVIKHLDGNKVEDYSMMKDESKRQFVPVGGWHPLMESSEYVDPQA